VDRSDTLLRADPEVVPLASVGGSHWKLPLRGVGLALACITHGETLYAEELE
jgi:hypothetical protein